MPVERNIYFANGDAYNLMGTIQYLYTIKDRMNIFEFDYNVAEIYDMKFLSIIDHDDVMYDIFTRQSLRRDEWFRRYGIRDETMAAFFGDLASIPGDIELQNIENVQETIEDDEEDVIIEGSRQWPFDLTDDELLVNDIPDVIVVNTPDNEREVAWEYTVLAGNPNQTLRDIDLA